MRSRWVVLLLLSSCMFTAALIDGSDDAEDDVLAVREQLFKRRKKHRPISFQVEEEEEASGDDRGPIVLDRRDVDDEADLAQKLKFKGYDGKRPILIKAGEEEEEPPRRTQRKRASDTASLALSDPDDVPVEPARKGSRKNKKQEPVVVRAEDGKCTAAMARRTAEVWLEKYKEESRCPTSSYLEKFQELAPKGHKVFFDIGCNKGYTSSKFFALWAPELNLTPQSLWKRFWRPKYGKYYHNEACGACSDCQEKVSTSLDSSQGSVRVFCIEPSLRNFERLLQAKRQFFLDVKPTIKWQMLNRAMANRTYFMPFDAACTDEDCTMLNPNNPTAEQTDLVEVTTVDRIVQGLSLSNIDVLKIDTEGYDPLVLQGAARVLKAGIAKMVQFEYHGVGPWLEYKLKDVVERMSELGYVCYFDGAVLTRITDCWVKEFEFHGWSNVVCVHKKHFMYAHLESIRLMV